MRLSFARCRLKPAAALAVLFALWTPAVAFGIHKLLLYSYTPGRSASPALELPQNPWIAAAQGKFTLLMFVHPQCPCSRASIGELARILALGGGAVTATVFFYAPATGTADFARTDLWREAAAIPDARAIEDRDGAAARLFGAFTSGETLLFGMSGRLAFHGGITPARGHAGDSAGRDAILSVMAGTPPTINSAPVFGCSIQGEN